MQCVIPGDDVYRLYEWNDHTIEPHLSKLIPGRLFKIVRVTKESIASPLAVWDVDIEYKENAKADFRLIKDAHICTTTRGLYHHLVVDGEKMIIGKYYHYHGGGYGRSRRATKKSRRNRRGNSKSK